jgi:hypothetical protein
MMSFPSPITQANVSYRPGLEVHHFPSKGVCSRIVGWKSGRIHHVFSKLERQWFYILEWSPKITGIREQFPLKLEETQTIADRLNFKHPRKPRAETDMVMTTDFLITNRDGSLWALSVKPSSELARRRIAEKLEIERIYWIEKGIKYQIGSEKELPPALVRNLEWIHPYYQIEESPQIIGAVANQINQQTLQGLPLREACINTDQILGLPPGTSLKITKHLIATKVLPVDMNQHLDPSKPLPIMIYGLENELTHRMA